MLMFMNAWMMLVLMKCRCQNAKLNTGVLQQWRPQLVKIIGYVCVNHKAPLSADLLSSYLKGCLYSFFICKDFEVASTVLDRNLLLRI